MNKFSVVAIIGMTELNSTNLFTTLLDMWKKKRQSQVKWMSMSEKENDKKFQINSLKVVHNSAQFFLLCNSSFQ